MIFTYHDNVVKKKFELKVFGQNVFLIVIGIMLLTGSIPRYQEYFNSINVFGNLIGGTLLLFSGLFCIIYGIRKLVIAKNWSIKLEKEVIWFKNIHNKWFPLYGYHEVYINLMYSVSNYEKLYFYELGLTNNSSHKNLILYQSNFSSKVKRLKLYLNDLIQLGEYLANNSYKPLKISLEPTKVAKIENRDESLLR